MMHIGLLVGLIPGIREHTGINLSEVYEDTEPWYFNTEHK